MKTHLFVALILVCSFNTVVAATVEKVGYDWLKTSETYGVSYDTMSTYCSRGTGQCSSGVISGIDLSKGWYWASISDVGALLQSYIGTQTTLSRNGNILHAIGGTWAQDVLNDFGKTPWLESGLYANTRDSLSGGGATVLIYQHTGYSSLSGGSTATYAGSVSNFIFRDVDYIEPTPQSAVPIPAAAFMFAPALLGFMGLRRKVKNSAV